MEKGAENWKSSTYNLFLNSGCLGFTKKYLRTKCKKRYTYVRYTRKTKLYVSDKAASTKKSAERQIVINSRWNTRGNEEFEYVNTKIVASRGKINQVPLRKKERKTQRNIASKTGLIWKMA